MTDSSSRPLARLAWFSLGWNMLVILWGAVVRATGSGAGCGAHWPTCNGEVIPLAPSVTTLIEYSHRLTSGVALILVALVLMRALKLRPAGHLGRFWAGAAMFFILAEAAVGAGLVLFERVAGDTSVARGYWMSAHLVNTFLLLATLALTARFADSDRTVAGGGLAAVRATFVFGRSHAAVPLSVLALFAIGISGAIAALGDTLFKATSLREAIAQDFSSTSHIFLRLRVLHPMIAIVGGLVLLAVAYRLVSVSSVAPRLRRLGVSLAALVVTQWGLGILNLLLLAPTWLQIVHLLVADLIWISVVLVASETVE